jgi:uncharacterized protein (DUF433 family)
VDSTKITGLKRRSHDCPYDDISITILRNNEVVLVASDRQTPTTNQMIREQVGEDWYEYVPLGKFVVSAPDVCRGRPTFKYTRIEVSGVLERLGAGHAIEDLIADSQGRLTQEAIAEAARLAAKALTQLVPAQAGAA